MNYGGMGWPYMLKLIENVPGLRMVFDTGNPVFSDDRTKKKPYPKQSSWEFYTHVKEHIEYVHIKDCVWDTSASKPKFTFAGEGDGDVKRIVKDLLGSGYNGGISMEPHLAVVFHDKTVQSEDSVKYANYVEYGRCFMAMLKELGY
jgi:sugar phosphate isomerase/epimerase